MSEQATEAGVKPGFKICTNTECTEFNPQPLENFWKSNTIKSGYESRCKTCHRIANRKQRAKRKQTVKPVILIKNCSSNECTSENPQPVDNFFKAADRPDGYNAFCKKCINRLFQKRMNVDLKTCTNVDCKCVNPQPITEFVSSSLHCKTCRVEYSRRWAQENRERYLTRTREYYSSHKTEFAESAKRRYDLNREARNAYSREYAKANIDRLRESARRRREADPQKYLESGRRYRAANPFLMKHLYGVRRKRVKEALGFYTAQDLQLKFELQGGLCYYCKQPLEQFDVEHKIPLARGGTNWPANICCACEKCNGSKHARDFWEFLRSIQDDRMRYRL